MAERGALVLVVGPRGAGKDALINLARRQLSREPRVTFPRRIITRKSGASDEVHQVVTPAQFEGLRKEGAFSLWWRKGGVGYALPSSIEKDLAAGHCVVASVSPAAAMEAAGRFGRVVAVGVEAPPAVRDRRLAQQGREPREPGGEEEAVRQALEACDEAVWLRHDGRVEEAARRLVDIVFRTIGRQPRRAGGDIPARMG